MTQMNSDGPRRGFICAYLCDLWFTFVTLGWATNKPSIFQPRFNPDLWRLNPKYSSRAFALSK